jgi:hypothetical protein
MARMGLIVNQRTIIGHIATLPKSLTEASPQGFARLAIVVTKNRLDGRRSGFQVVVGNAQENVVGHMGADVVMKVVKHPVISVNGGEGALQEAPILTPIPGNFGSGMEQ